MKVLHVLYQSYPNISGSSTRSRSIVNSQKAHGICPVVITSPFQDGLNVRSGVEAIDDVNYYRVYADNKSFALGRKKSAITRVKKLLTMVPFFWEVYRVAKKENVDVVHSHAMFFTAIPSMIVCKLLKVPHVYEIRSEWSKNSNFTSSVFTKKLMAAVERLVVYCSGNLVVISQGLYDKYDGVASSITLVANAVSDDVVSAGEGFALPVKKDVLVLGYVGSVLSLEGIDYVIEALTRVKAGKFKFIVVGGGPYLETLRERVAEFGLENIEFLGPIDPKAVEDVYSQLDIVINYRVDEPVAHSVTPLKPLEAMAYKKLVIVSDVGGMTELVTDMVTGVVVPSGDPRLLAEKLDEVYLNFDRYQDVILEGAAYVKSKKMWSRNSLVYKKMYLDLIGESN